jgi:hypothetical protein
MPLNIYFLRFAVGLFEVPALLAILFFFTTFFSLKHPWRYPTPHQQFRPYLQ